MKLVLLEGLNKYLGVSCLFIPLYDESLSVFFTLSEVFEGIDMKWLVSLSLRAQLKHVANYDYVL